MGFSSAFKENIMTNIGVKLKYCRLLDNAASASLDDDIGDYDRVSSSEIWTTWTNSFDGLSLSSTNKLFESFPGADDENPLLFTIKAGENPNRLAFRENAGSDILALHDTGKTTYASDDIIYIRKITLTINEV